MIDDAEERVDRMIERGTAIMRAAIETYKPVAVVAAFSSGNDSSVSTHFAMSNNLADYVLNIDTLTGFAPSRCHLESVCSKHNWELHTAKATPEGPPNRMNVGGKLVPYDFRILPAGKWTDGDSAYEEFCLNFGFPGRGMHPRMYQRLKERPICRVLKSHGAAKREGAPKVLIVSGIRHDESSIRAGYKRDTAEGAYGDVWVNPHYWQTALDFEAYRQEFGLPRNPVKDLVGISGDCNCGTFGDGCERATHKIADAAFDMYLTDLQKRVNANGFPWGWGESAPPEWIAAQRIVKDAKRGQGFLFEADERVSLFQPMCVGCNNGRR